MRPASLVRLVLGTSCLTVPRAVLGAVGAPDRADHTAQVVTRVLGGRLVVQAVADLALGRRTRVPDILVDLAHAASMVPAAARWREHRRSALTSAALATAIAVLDLRDTPDQRHRA